MQIAGHDIRRVAVIDDNELSRQTVADVVKDMELEPFCPSSLPDFNVAISTVTGNSNAMISDHRLNVSGFSPFNGAELVAESYKKCHPALLCTSWSSPAKDELIPYRQWIPKVLEPPVNPDMVFDGLEIVLKEFKGEYKQWRKPWRALVRIEDVKRSDRYPELFLVVPSWNPHRKLGIPLSMLPKKISDHVQPGDRLHALVNLGSEETTDLYFSDWEEK